MATQLDTLIDRIRIMIGDASDDVNEHRHSDIYLKKVLRVAIEQDQGLESAGLSATVSSQGNSYSEYALSGLTDAALSLYSLAATLLVFDSELRQYIADGGGIATAIGPNSVDEKTVLKSMADLLKDTKKDYARVLNEYKLGASNLLVPYRIDLYASGRVA